MVRLGFCEVWVELVMKCVSSVSYKIRVNGQLTDSFRPERGLWQGDPLSPYLFFLCAESFSAMLERAELEGELRGIKIGTVSYGNQGTGGNFGNSNGGHWIPIRGQWTELGTFFIQAPTPPPTVPFVFCKSPLRP